MNKDQLREEISKKRKVLDKNMVKTDSEIIVAFLQNLPDLKQAKVVLSYMPYGKEVDVKPLNQWILDQCKVLCLPRVISKTKMEARIVNNLKLGLCKSTFGILEPTIENQLIDSDKIDLILVPGLAFDKEGNRLGHGSGYYDRFLSSCTKNILFVGVAYSFQVFDSIPFDNYDIKVHGIVTEKFTVNVQ